MTSFIVKTVRDIVGVTHAMLLMYYGGQVMGILLYPWLLYRGYYTLFFAYTLWYIYDFKTPERGGRPNKFWHNTLVFRCLRDYFPCKLLKTAELPTDKNYIFLCHPHGLLGFGILLNFATDVTGFTTTFPGIRNVVASIRLLHLMPFFREYCLLSHLIAVTKESLMYYLTSERNSGKSVCVVVGGTRELLEAYPGSTKTVIKDRKGIFKIALKTGASLVPVYTFGENDLFRQLHNVQGFEWLKNIWLKMIEKFGFSLLFSLNLVPKRRPLFTVVGKPIEVKMREDPSGEDIDNLQKTYMNALEKLFDENKIRCGYKAEQRIEFI